MTPIEHADSIIEESVISTSPCGHVDTDNDTSTNAADTTEPPLFRRATRVYGRTKLSQNDGDDLQYSGSSRARTLRTAPPDEKLVIPESEDASTSIAANYSGYKWRQQLDKIDAHFDRESNDAPCVSVDVSSESFVDHENTLCASLFDGTLSSLPSEDSGAPSEQLDTGNIKDDLKSSDEPSKEGEGLLSDDSTKRPLPPHKALIRNKSLRRSSSSPIADINEMYGKAADEVEATETLESRQRRKEKRRPRKASQKELQEIQKESARLLAERTVEILKPEQRPARTMCDFFNRFSKNASTQNSDPILSFSSPDTSNLLQTPPSSTKAAKEVPPTELRHSTPRKGQQGFSTVDSEQGSDPEMPTAKSILEEDITRRAGKLAEDARMRELKERKIRALMSKATPTSSDDDLEVEKLVTPQFRKVYRMSTGSASKYQPGLKHKQNTEDTEALQMNLELAAKPLFNANTTNQMKPGHPSAMSHQSLNQILLQRAEIQSFELEEKKKEKWIQRGGSLKSVKPSGESTIESWLQKGSKSGLETSNEEDAPIMEADSDNPEEIDVHDGGREQDGKHTTERSEEMSEAGTISGEDEEDKENRQPILRRPRRSIVIDSDDENDTKSVGQERSPIVLVRDSSRLGDSDYEVRDGASEGSSYEDENKENVSHGRNFNDDDLVFPICESSISRRISRTPFNAFDEGSSQGMDTPFTSTGNQSRILQVLHEEDKANTLKSVQSSPFDRAGELSFSSSMEEFEGSTLVSSEHFPQFVTNAEERTVEEPPPTPLVAGGFSQFFPLSKNHSDTALTNAESGRPFSLIKEKEFEFTQPNALLPSVQISESQRREVDDMFNKDQDYKLDEAKRANIEARMSDLSRPKAPYFGSFIASPQADVSPMIRQPLATMSLMSIEDSEEVTMADEEFPRFKLTRFRRERPPDQLESPSPSSVSKTRNAFEVLKDASIEKQKKAAAKAIRSEFIEGEAQESDDEFYADFGGINKHEDDEEEENDDQYAIVEGLVDDTVLDEETMAKNLVLEKHKEFEGQDEAVLLKYHQDAIEGKMRIKRKNIGIEDSESEDEEGSRPRKQYSKKRRIEGDTLEACAENPETRAFFDAYQQSLVEDNEDQISLGPTEHPLAKGSEDGMSEEEEECGEQETIDVSKLRAELRERALEDEEDGSSRPDPEDVTWVDEDEVQATDDIEVQIEQGMLQGKSNIQDTSSTALRFNGNFVTNYASSLEKTRLKAWASEESQTRSAGGRGGFSRREEKEKGHSAQKSNHRSSNTNHTENTSPKPTRPTTTTSSLITSVLKQKGFED